jgi:hypothetical protein
MWHLFCAVIWITIKTVMLIAKILGDWQPLEKLPHETKVEEDQCSSCDGKVFGPERNA